MPSALETLVKILKLEQDTGYKNMAVIGGLEEFVENWQHEAHQQAKQPVHHQLIEELVERLHHYGPAHAQERHTSIKYLLGRIMGRIPPPADLPPITYTPPEKTELPPAVIESIPDSTTGTHALGATPQPASDAPVSQLMKAPATPAAEHPKPKHEAPTLPTFSRRKQHETLSTEETAQRLAALQAPITDLHKVGDKMAEKLGKLDIATIEDILFTFPRRYNDYTQMRTLNHLQPGEVVTVIVAVRTVVQKQGRGKRPYLLVTLDDGTGCLQVTFFGQPWLQRQFKRGSRVVLSGKIDLFRGELAMINPEWEMVEHEQLHTNRIVPVYALTKGLSVRTMRRLLRQAITTWGDRVLEHIPTSVLDRTDLPSLEWSLQQIHFPESFEALEQARKRLSFDELFLFQLAMHTQRRDWQTVPSQALRVSDEWLAQFQSTLPYSLTPAQIQSLNDIRVDIAQDIPMNRLLQGDVGSGKTVVAAAAMAIAVQNGKQAALMAPTSILAEQHARSLDQLLRQSPGGEQLQIRLLTGYTPDAERQEIYAGLADGSIQVVIGTHALIQARVTFHNLALVVVDEQHRFGVQQRGTLRGKGTNPHVLVMTATPIPRTLALTLYADLDLSIIDEMPPGRTPIETRILHQVERERAYAFIRSQLDKGRQAFIVYPLVETSDKMEDLGAAVDEYERLGEHIFFAYRVGLLHGRMKSTEKDTIMQAFAAGEIDVLVSTSVVEVGIDVPNASVIMIENADRFGLAQLHQFRGRVGRGAHPSFCLLATKTTQAEAEQRLMAMEETTDGFKLAEIDWAMRGSGSLLGVRQSGLGQFRLAELMHPQLVELAQREARTIYAEDPHLTQPEHQLLVHHIKKLLDQRTDVS